MGFPLSRQANAYLILALTQVNQNRKNRTKTKRVEFFNGFSLLLIDTNRTIWDLRQQLIRVLFKVFDWNTDSSVNRTTKWHMPRDYCFCLGFVRTANMWKPDWHHLWFPFFGKWLLKILRMKSNCDWGSWRINIFDVNIFNIFHSQRILTTDAIDVTQE